MTTAQGLARRSAMVRLKRDVISLASLETREVGTRGHLQARAYIAARMTEVGLQPYRGTWIHEYGPGLANVVGLLPGIDSSAAPLLIGAHYDTCGRQPGADDNATGVAIVLSLAEALQGGPRNRSILFVAFDAEEPPWFMSEDMGSIAFFERQGGSDVAAALILDIVGHDFPLPLRKRAIVVTGAESHHSLAAALERLGQPAGLNVLVAHSRYVTEGDAVDLSDYHIFRRNGRPFLFLSAGHWPHYHQATDTPDRIDFGKVNAVGEYMSQIADLLDMDRGLAQPDPHETLDLELKTLRQVLGPAGMIASATIRSREDVDRIAAFLRARLGI